MLVFYLNAIFLFYLHHRQQEQWKYSVLILFSSILFCSARDPGMYFVLIVSLGFLLERIFLFPNQVKRKALLVNAVAGFLVFVAFQSMFNHTIIILLKSFLTNIFLNMIGCRHALIKSMHYTVSY